MANDFEFLYSYFVTQTMPYIAIAEAILAANGLVSLEIR